MTELPERVPCNPRVTEWREPRPPPSDPDLWVRSDTGGGLLEALPLILAVLIALAFAVFFGFIIGYTLRGP